MASELVTNPFGRTQETPDALVEVGSQREASEVQAAMVIAQRFPRDPVQATDRILQACTRPSLAESAVYSFSRGGSDVSGPSIRLAEVAAQAWGNVAFGVREIEQRPGVSTVEAFAWDLETNVRLSRTFQVPHERHTRSGVKKLQDPRDIYEHIAGQGARRLRACILGVVPGDVIEAATEQCMQTLRETVDVTPEGVKKLVAAFKELGVTQSQIEKRIQARLQAIRPAQVVQLRKVYNSIRDGMSGPEDWFEAPPEKKVADLAPKEEAPKEAKE